MSINIGRIDIEPIINYTKNRNEAVEIGSWVGNTTKQLSNKFEKVYAIDPYEGGYDDEDKCSSQPMDEIENEFKENMKGLKNIVHIKEKSNQAINKFEDESLDFVFIDGSHKYEDVKEDIETWKNKIAPNGCIAGHDYHIIEGVTKAVDEIFPKEKIQIHAGCWFVKI
jgi:hypothetical protein